MLGLLSMGVVIFISCKKEHSCEGCSDNKNNKPPIAVAGPDQVITLPTDSVSLDGSTSHDLDGTISSFQWSKVSGPVSFNINNAAAARTVVKNLAAGIYQFELKVTDAGALTGKDTMQVIVNAHAVTGSCANRPVINVNLIPIGNLSSARIGLQCATAGNKILFIGGSHSGQNWWNEPVPVDIYDISNNTWSVHLLVPDNPQFTHFRYGAGVTSVGNEIFIAGGGDGFGDNQTSRVDIYDASTNTWSTAELSAARQGLVAATVGDKVLFAGGFGYPDGSNWGEFNTVDIYDNSNNSWSTATLSQARMDITATTAGSKIYFAGGFIGGINASKTIDIYDVVTNSWSVSSLQQPRTWMASIFAGGKIFWAGGANIWNGAEWVNNDNTEILDLSSGVTSSVCILPRSRFSAVTKNENIVFFTSYGSDPRNGTHFEIYNLTTNTWSTGVLPVKIQGSSIISVNNTIYVAGGNVNGSFSNQVWKLEF